MGQIETYRDFTFCETYPYNNKFVTVAVNTADLRANFLAEATAQNGQPRRIRQIDRILEFGIDSENEAERNESNAAAFVSNYDDLVFCQLNLAIIISKIGRGKLGIIDIPRKMTPEAKDASVLQVLDGIWRHERQHLIQIVQQDKIENDHTTRRLEKFTKLANSAQNTVSAGFIVALGSLLLPTEYAIPGVIGGITTTAAAKAAKRFILNWRNHKDPVEVEAYKWNNSELFTGVSPFKVSFES